MGRVLVWLLFGAVTTTILADDRSPPAVERWADPRLTVTRGLVVWLDAARLPEARKAAGLAPLAEGDSIDLWPDGSGSKHHVAQKQAEAAITPS